MKFIIILYLIIIIGMVLMIPIKLLTSKQLKCPHCQRSVLISKKKKEIICPHCGELIS